MSDRLQKAMRKLAYLGSDKKARSYRVRIYKSHEEPNGRVIDRGAIVNSGPRSILQLLKKGEEVIVTMTVGEVETQYGVSRHDKVKCPKKPGDIKFLVACLANCRQNASCGPVLKKLETLQTKAG